MKVIKVGKTADSIGYILIIPNNVNKDSRILLSMTDVVGMGDVFTQEENGKNTISDPRIKALAEKADMPIMIPLIDSYVDEDGREISKPEKYEGESSEAYEKRYNAFKTKLSEYTEFYPQTLESKLFQKYDNAIENAYNLLENKSILSVGNEHMIDVEGYSAQGVKAQRLSMLIPQRIQNCIVGGAITSIPLPLREMNGIVFNYPSGFADIEQYFGGGSFDEILKRYKKIRQHYYTTEYEIATPPSRNISLEDNPYGLSQHDMSPDVIDVVNNQLSIFGIDINNRVRQAIDVCRKSGCIFFDPIIYPGVSHHIEDTKIRNQSIENLFAILHGKAHKIESPLSKIETDARKLNEYRRKNNIPIIEGTDTKKDEYDDDVR